VRSQISEQTPRTFVGAGRSLFDRRERLRGRFQRLLGRPRRSL